MKIKYINEITYCCKCMEDYKFMYNFFTYTENEARLNVYAPNRIDFLIREIHYCPFCGEKIELIKK